MRSNNRRGEDACFLVVNEAHGRRALDAAERRKKAHLVDDSRHCRHQIISARGWSAPGR